MGVFFFNLLEDQCLLSVVIFQLINLLRFLYIFLLKHYYLISILCIHLFYLVFKLVKLCLSMKKLMGHKLSKR